MCPVRLLGDADVLGLGEETQRFFAAFAADAALFHAAKRDAQIADKPAVYPDGAGVDLFGDAMGAAQVLGPDARGESIVHVVGVADHLVFAVERRDGHNWTENFFAVGAAANRQAGQDRGRKEIAVPTAVVDGIGGLAAKGDLAAFLL